MVRLNADDLEIIDNNAMVKIRTHVIKRDASHLYSVEYAQSKRFYLSRLGASALLRI